MTPTHAPDDWSHLSGLTPALATFVAHHRFEDLDAETLHLARRCVLDGLSVALAGTDQPGMAPLKAYIYTLGGAGQARMLGLAGAARMPAHLAALWAGTAGHAMDWDDTQLAEGPGRPYGLLMHPTMPPLVAALTISDLIASETGTAVDGKRFIAAFTAGF